MLKRASNVLVITGLLIALLGGTLVMLAQDSTSIVDAPLPYTGTPTSGEWQGVAYFGPADSQLAAPVLFTVGSDGSLSGSIRFTFQYAGMAENLVALMNENGCVTTFDTITPDVAPVSGYFMDAARAVGTFEATACFLDGYGDLTFGAPVTGVWYAEQSAAGDGPLVFAVEPTAAGDSAATEESAPATEQAPATEAPADTAAGTDGAEAVPAADGSVLGTVVPVAAVDMFLDNCSECHGYFGEGGPGVADLTAPAVQRMSDEAIMEVINNGVEGTEMEPWGRLLTEEEKAWSILVIRNPTVLREYYDANNQ